MPVFRWDKVLGIARSAKEFLKLPESNVAPDAATDAEQGGERTVNRKEARRRASEQQQRLKAKRGDTRRELSRIKRDLDTAKSKMEKGWAEKSEQAKRARKKRHELLRLKSELRAAKEQSGSKGPETGALPDFVIIGPGRCGTTFFYRLLSEHPHVEPAAKKELRFFSHLYEEGTEWYRQWFPQPKWKDGRRSITGEATPGYIYHPLVPERIAKVIPQARLIAMLRNPVDRTYSAYQHRVSKGRESRMFEEAIEIDLADGSMRLLSRSIYADHLVHWTEFLDRGQLLVLKSEDLFERPQETLDLTLDFLGLPDWEPDVWKSGKDTVYEEIDAATRRRLEEYFEPHNRRLYDFLGTDFGW